MVVRPPPLPAAGNGLPIPSRAPRAHRARRLRSRPRPPSRRTLQPPRQSRRGRRRRDRRARREGRRAPAPAGASHGPKSDRGWFCYRNTCHGPPCPLPRRRPSHTGSDVRAGSCLPFAQPSRRGRGPGRAPAVDANPAQIVHVDVEAVADALEGEDCPAIGRLQPRARLIEQEPRCGVARPATLR